MDKNDRLAGYNAAKRFWGWVLTSATLTASGTAVFYIHITQAIGQTVGQVAYYACANSTWDPSCLPITANTLRILIGAGIATLVSAIQFFRASRKAGVTSIEMK